MRLDERWEKIKLNAFRRLFINLQVRRAHRVNIYSRFFWGITWRAIFEESDFIFR